MSDEQWRIRCTNDDFLNKLVRDGIVEWLTCYPWSGYYITGTNLVLRESDRIMEEWGIFTRRFNIGVKLIWPYETLESKWPTPEEMAKLDVYGKECDERFSQTDDF